MTLPQQIETACDDCGEVARQFPEDPEIWLCRCDTTPAEWNNGHLMTDIDVLGRQLARLDGAR